jgi:uncharacterized protein
MEFSKEEIHRLLQSMVRHIESKAIPKFVLGIVGTGEPMLSFALIREIVEYLKYHSKTELFRLYTISNGTILTDEQLDFFVENTALIDYNVSLDGDRDMHNTGRGRFDEVMLNIQKYERRIGRKPIVNAVVNRTTIQNDESTIRFFKENGFHKVNFSIYFGNPNSDMAISQTEYHGFLDACAVQGIVSRQTQTNSKKKIDCAKYGNQCGVGITNVFITRAGIYPCSRFVGMDEYLLGTFDANWDDIETRLKKLDPVSDDSCYYDKYVLGRTA